MNLLRGARLLAVLVLLALGGCAAPGEDDGIGGTGVQERSDSDGIGGTGVRARSDSDGIGGTGVQARSNPDGIGGTGVQAQSDSDGIGGTGIQAFPDGIGGTGLRAWLDPDGIGGTGIVGEVTALGSIRIGDLDIDVPAGARVSLDGATATPGELAPGQIVAVLAATVDGRLQAREVRVQHALVGPVRAIERGTGRVNLMGMGLRIQPGRTIIGASLGGLTGIGDGDRLRVSGLWRGDTLEVTRIDRAAADQPDSVYAPLTIRADGAATLGPLTVTGATGRAITGPDAGAARATVQPGQYVAASGIGAAQGLRAMRFDPQPRIPFAGRIARLIVEGYAAAGVRGRVHVGPLSGVLAGGATLRDGIAQSAANGQRIVVLANVRGGRAEIRDLKPVRPPPLRPGAGALRPPSTVVTVPPAVLAAPQPPAATSTTITTIPQPRPPVPRPEPTFRIITDAQRTAPAPTDTRPVLSPERKRTDTRVRAVDAVRAPAPTVTPAAGLR